MIFKGSRFVGEKLFMDTDNAMPYMAQVNTHRDKSVNDLVYLFKAGDRLDILSNRFYGDSQKGWIILYANPEYLNETEITEGCTLIIPNPQEVDI